MRFAFSLGFLFSISGAAMAYIGPGAGLGAIAIVVALVVGFLLLVVGFVWFPLKRKLKAKRRGNSEESSDADR